MTDTAPRIYVACLASYNAGKLYGRWIDASTDIDAMNAEIQEMLAGSPEPNVIRQRYKDGEGATRYVDADSFRAEPIPEDWEKIGERYASAEEWAIHDYEGLGSDLGEYAGLAEVAKRVALIEVADDMGLPVPVLMEAANDHCGKDDDADTIKDTLEDRYRGKYDSWEDFAEEFTREVNDMSEVPEWLQNHIDWESVARDFRLGGDFSAIEHEGDFYFFWNH